MKKLHAVTIKQSITSSTLEKFDMLRGEVDRSPAVLKVLQFFIDYDINYIRGILGLPNLSEQEVGQIKSFVPTSEQETTAIVPVESQ